MKQTDQIEVFVNQNGGITIKQTDSYGEEVVVVFWAENVEDIVAGITAAKEEIERAEQE